MSTQLQGTRSKTKTTSPYGRQLVDALSRMPFIDSAELALILGQPHETVHRALTSLLGFATPSDFVRAYPVSSEWLTLLIRRMDAVAAVYRLAASLSPGTRSLRSHVEFHRRGRFDATITLHDGRGFGVVRQGHSGVRLHAPPGHDPDPDPQRLGAEADDEVLHGTES